MSGSSGNSSGVKPAVTSGTGANQTPVSNATGSSSGIINTNVISPANPRTQASHPPAKPIDEHTVKLAAQTDLLTEIKKYKSREHAREYATMIVAYDPLTGKRAIGNSNATITAETLHVDTVKYIEKQLNVKIGDFTTFCKNKVGACAEVSGADQLVRQGVTPSRIKFTEAVRPVRVYDEGAITPDTIIPTCKNCQVTWPKGTKK